VKYLFDSNIIIRTTLGIGEALRRRVAACDDGDIVTSSIAYAEVAYGSVRGKPPAFEKLQAFIEEVPVLEFDYKAARAYATLSFKRASFDRLIAAHALSHDLIVVTDNETHFADVPGLKVENWTE
jgi:tRNA(fMet)-specific endonuclease VapC